MRLFKTLCVAFILPAALSTARAGVPLVDLVSEDSADVLIIHDTPGVLKKWETTPWMKTWNDPQMKKFLAPLRAKIKIDEWDDIVKAKTGLTLDDFKNFIQGDCLLRFTSLDDISFDASKKSSPNDGGMPPLFLAQLGAGISQTHSLTDALFKKNEELINKNGDSFDTETYAGIILSIVTFNSADKNGSSPTLAWAIVDGTLIASTDKTTVMATIDALQKGGLENSLGKSERYQRIQAATRDCQVLNIINLPAFEARFIGNLHGAADNSSRIHALGLDAIGDIFLGLTLKDDRAEITGAVTCAEKRGLLDLLSAIGSPAEIPSYAPASWFNFNITKLDLPKVWDVIEKVLSLVGQSANPVEAGIAQASASYHINIKRDLIGNLGDEIAIANSLPPGVTFDTPDFALKINNLYVLSLRDARTFSNTLENLKQASGLNDSPLLTKRTLLGAAIYTFQISAAKVVSYAIVQNKLLIGYGDPSALDAAVQALVNGPASALKDRPEIRRAYAEAPADLCSFTFQDPRCFLLAFLTLFPKQAGAENYFDATNAPDAALLGKYWGDYYGWSTNETDGLHFTWKLTYPQ